MTKHIWTKPTRLTDCAPETQALETKALETKALETKVLETKTLDASGELESLHRMLHEFRSEYESKSREDVVRDEKLDRLNAAIDVQNRKMSAFQIKAQRPAFGAEAAIDDRGCEHKAAFQSYMRSGASEALARLEAKAVNGTVGPDGGYVVPPDVERGILTRMAALSPIRSIANVQALVGPTLRKAVSPNGATRGWTADAAPSNSADPNFLNDLSFPTAELYCQPAATQTMLDDPAIDIESWIAGEVERAFALAESSAFVTGNGVNKPQGFLSVPTIANANWSWGNLGFLTTGVAGAFAASNPSDTLVDLVHALKTAYRPNASFAMNRKTQSAIRKLKDAQGNYLWQAPNLIGGKATLMNFPIVEVEDMPDIAANSLSIAFGDFSAGYVVVDRIGIRALRDPYSAKPYVLFYTTKRVGGGVQDYEAIKLLKFSA